METIRDRILFLLKKKEVTKTEFASKLNITQAYVSKITNKGAIPSDRLIEDICEKFAVNEEWLRTGEGEMFVTLNRTQQIAQLTADLFKGEKDSFKERLLLALAKLDENEWKVLEKIAEDLTKEKDQVFPNP